MTRLACGKRIVGCLILFLAVSSASAWAQFTSAIAGTVTDLSGAVVPNATVTIRNMQTGENRSVNTSSDGFYRFSSLPAALFNVTVSASGFKTLVQENIRLTVDEVNTLNLKMAVGTVSQQVTVSDAPPPVELSEARVSGLVDEKNVQDLPLVGRNFYTLVVLTPGVTGLPSGGGQPYAQANADVFNQEYGVNLNAGGMRSESNSFLVDSASVNSPARGGVVNINPNADDVQELRISVNNFSAEFGHGASALVNVVTKEGTNQYHGTASWFHTDNALSARTYFQSKVPVFRRNEGSWGFGGPIRKNRTFFFVSGDILRSGVGQSVTGVVETPAFVNYMTQNQPNSIATKLFTNFGPAASPTTNFLTAGNIAGANCATLPSPSTAIPTPIGAVPCNLALLGTATTQFTLPRDGNQWSVRVDHLFNGQQDRLYGNVMRTTISQGGNASIRPQFLQTTTGGTLNLILDETHVFSPRLMNEISVNSTRASGRTPCVHCDVPMAVNIVGMSGFGAGGPGTFVTSTYGLREIITSTRGSHNLKMGVDVWRPHGDANFTGVFERPVFIFPNPFFFGADHPVVEGNVSYDPQTGGLPSYVLNLRQWEYHVFIQDDWKVTRNLALNLGLRYENFGNPTQVNGRIANVFFGSGSDFATQVANASVQPVKHIWKGADNHNFSPRFGFAWDPIGSGNMSIRGGVGVFYDYPFLQIPQASVSNPPFFAQVTASIFTPPYLPAYGLGTSQTAPFGFPRPSWVKAGLDSKNGLTAGKANITGSQLNFATAYSYNWFFGIQRALSRDWVVEANYVGSSGHDEYGGTDVNRVDGDLITHNGVLTRLNSSFGAINYIQPKYTSNYTGGNASIRGRAFHGLTMQAAYTVGKAIDMLSATTIGFAEANNPGRERGLANFDVRQKLALSLIWELPKHNFGSAFANGLLSGWEFGDVTILQSGTPYSVICTAPFSPVRNAAGVIIGNSGCDYNADGNNFDYPNTPAFGNHKNGSRSDLINGLFTAADFPTPPLGQEGNLGRNTFIGPEYADSDMTLMKDFNLMHSETTKLQFRTDFFNAFNRVNLVGIHSDLADPLFGKATSTYPARDIQFALRLSF